MKSRVLLAVLPLSLVALSACDTDEDGLTNKLEEEFGTDPEVADTDGDGLSDLEEYDLGTDGTAWDSDGDSYGDYDEVQEGTDPTDPESRIYTGYWPYNPDKDSIVDPGLTCAMGVDCGAEGNIMPRLQWQDQFGDIVDSYDFAMQGRYMVVDVSGYWCGWCTEMADWLVGKNDTYHSENYGFSTANEIIPQLVQSGELYWMTILDSWGGNSPAEPGDAADWADYFPNPVVPVLEDTDWNMKSYMDIYEYPFLFLVDENMEIVVNTGEYNSVFNEITYQFSDWEAGE